MLTVINSENVCFEACVICKDFDSIESDLLFGGFKHQGRDLRELMIQTMVKGIIGYLREVCELSLEEGEQENKWVKRMQIWNTKKICGFRGQGR